ncbi:hypothetical protein MASR2M29_10040 [Spirochaetota bacterium]
MKRILIISLALALLASGVFGQGKVLGTMAPKDARTMGMGGSFVAMSTGYQSFYGNPAAFADTKSELTVLSTTAWAYVKPTTDNIQKATSFGGMEQQEQITALSSLLTENGLGAGTSLGIGWVGKGLGIGFVNTADVYLKGKNLLGAKGEANAESAVIVGVGLPLTLGPLKFQLGGDIRPHMRVTGNVYASDLLGGMFQGGGETNFDPGEIELDSGFGIALDLGAKLDLGSLVSVGLAIRDIAPPLKLQTVAAKDIFGAMGGGDKGDEVSYSLLPNIVLGASITPIPVGLRKLVDVNITAELQDPVNLVVNKLSPFSLLHLGAEGKFLNGLLAARLGVNKGYVSLGAGIDLLFMDLNVALFTEELGKRPGDKPRTGIAAEIAFRF